MLYTYFQVAPPILFSKSVHKIIIACQYYMDHISDLSQSCRLIFLSQVTKICIHSTVNKFEQFLEMSSFIETLHILVKPSLVWNISSHIVSQVVISFFLLH